MPPVAGLRHGDDGSHPRSLHFPITVLPDVPSPRSVTRREKGKELWLAVQSRTNSVQVRRLILERFRGYDRLEWCPRECNLILGPNNAGKSTILEALDWLFDPGWGRPRPI